MRVPVKVKVNVLHRRCRCFVRWFVQPLLLLWLPLCCCCDCAGILHIVRCRLFSTHTYTYAVLRRTRARLLARLREFRYTIARARACACAQVLPTLFTTIRAHLKLCSRCFSTFPMAERTRGEQRAGFVRQQQQQPSGEPSFCANVRACACAEHAMTLTLAMRVLCACREPPCTGAAARCRVFGCVCRYIHTYSTRCQVSKKYPPQTMCLWRLFSVDLNDCRRWNMVLSSFSSCILSVN